MRFIINVYTNYEIKKGVFTSYLFALEQLLQSKNANHILKSAFGNKDQQQRLIASLKILRIEKVNGTKNAYNTLSFMNKFPSSE